MKWYIIPEDKESSTIFFQGSSDECDAKIQLFSQATISSETAYNSRCDRIRNIVRDMKDHGGEIQAQKIIEKNSNLFSKEDN